MNQPDLVPQKGGNDPAASAVREASYGTGVKPRKKKRSVGLIVGLSFLLLLFASFIVFSHFFMIRFDRTERGLFIRIVPQNSQLSVDRRSRGFSDPFASDSSFDPPDWQERDTLSLPEIYAKVSPSVVTVCTSSVLAGEDVASGVILTSDGYLVTNRHLLSGSPRLTVVLSDGREFPATVFASDEISDLAVLKIAATGLTPAVMGDSDALLVGEPVAAIGSPLGTKLYGTLTSGIVSAINREVDIGGTAMTLIQTDAALNNGNSGGPLINCYGEVIGINTAKVDSKSSPVEGIGFAIPSNNVRKVVSELMAHGYVSGRATMQITVAEMDALQRAYLGLPEGVFITSVADSSNAYAAGLRYGDILVTLDGQSIVSAAGLASVLESCHPGDQVNVIIFRNSKYFSAEFALEEQTQ